MAETYFYFKGKDIKCINAEIVKNSAVNTHENTVSASDVIKGLLAGFSLKTDDDNSEHINAMLSLKTDSKSYQSFQSFNLDVYGVMSIEIFHGTLKEEIYFQRKNNDQIIAQEMISELIEKLDGAGMMKKGCEEIDIDKYEKNKSISIPNANDTTHNSVIYSSTSTKTYNKSEPTVFGRTTELPSKEAFVSMKENVQKISAGDYKPEPFKLVTDEKGEEIEDWEDEFYDTKGYRYGCMGY